MDRVLLIIDDIQYSRHVEMTLRKVGFDVESINNEFNLTESVLTFNPNYILCRGNTSRLSVLNVGKKLKDSSSKFNGKSILIFSENYKIAPEDLSKIRGDLILFDPVSTLKLAMHLFSFSESDFEFFRDKLLKFAITDNQFRNYEQQILKSAGLTIDSEIQVISSMDRMAPPVESKTHSGLDMLDDNSEPDQLFHEENEASEPVAALEKNVGVAPLFPPPENLSVEAREKINDEVKTLKKELPLRIDTYNHAVKDVEQNLSVGLNKRQTKKALNALRKDLINVQKIDEKSEQKLHDEKIRYAQTLFKKKS